MADTTQEQDLKKAEQDTKRISSSNLVKSKWNDISGDESEDSSS